MYHASNEKRETTYDGRNKTTKSRKKIRMLGERGSYEYLGILEADTIEQFKKEYLKRTRRLLGTKLYSRNFIKGINTFAVPLVRYSWPFLKWTRKELRQIDQKTRKPMTMHKALHPRDEANRLSLSKKEGGRGYDSIKDSVDASIQWLKDNIKKSAEED